MRKDHFFLFYTMAKLYLTLLCLIALNCHSQDLKTLILTQNTELTDVEIKQFKQEESLFFVLKIQEQGWLETLEICKYQDGKILWQARFNPSLNGQSIESFRDIKISGLDQICIEIYDISHKGNGSIYLYTLNNQSLTCILKTYTLDTNFDYNYNELGYSRLFKGGKLKVKYKDINQDQIDDIILFGKAQIYGKNEKIVKKYPVKKVFIFNQEQFRYEVDLNKCTGF